MNNLNYFASKLTDANQSHFGFDAEFYASGNNNPYVFGSGESNNGVTSTPFVVTLYNSTGADIQTDFLDAATAIINKSSNYGITAGIVASYGIPGISYEAFLYDLLTASVWIYPTYIESATSLQLSQGITVATKNTRGDYQGRYMQPLKNINQNVTDAVILPDEFILNKFTKLTTTIKAGATCTYRLFPKAAQNSAGSLLGKEVNVFTPNQNLGLPRG